MTISAPAVELLQQMYNAVDGVVIPPQPSVDRKVYEEVNMVLVRLGGKWKTRKGHIFPSDPRDALGHILATGEMPPKNPYDFFPTPRQWARFAAGMLPVNMDLKRVLEPSAGDGALARAVQELSRLASIHCVEIDAHRRDALRNQGFTVIGVDFLEVLPGTHTDTYDAVVMNPPFTAPKNPLAYIDHIYHAWNFLEAGGRLIALAPLGFTFRSDKKSVAFLEWVQTYGTFQRLPSDAFKESGTGVATVLIVVNKPASVAQ